MVLLFYTTLEVYTIYGMVSGGSVAKVAREALEAETGQLVITAQNAAQMGTVVTELIEAVASENEEK